MSRFSFLKFYVFVAVIALSITIVSCDKNNNSNNNNNQITMKLNGNSWAGTGYYSTGNGVTVLSGAQTSDGTGVGITFSNGISIGTFPIDAFNVVGSYTAGSSGLYSSDTGTVTITSLDPVNGTFSFTAYEFFSNAKVTITDGKLNNVPIQ